MNLELFKKILTVDSTSGRERELSGLLAGWLVDSVPEDVPRPVLERFEVGDGTENLLFSWGKPEVVFCTYIDTVPPYIPPVFTERAVHGRGSCDAKGQIFSMYSACLELAAAGHEGFALLLLSGEETGSYGAKAFARTSFRAPLVVVGEPTENRMASASKGTKSYDLVFHGEAFHSGYPEHGRSAVDLFVDFYNQLSAKDFGMDGVLGKTSFNVGLLHSDNPQNILSPELGCRVYFRTTFISDDEVVRYMAGLPDSVAVCPRGGDTPAAYLLHTDPTSMFFCKILRWLSDSMLIYLRDGTDND